MKFSVVMLMMMSSYLYGGNITIPTTVGKVVIPGSEGRELFSELISDFMYRTRKDDSSFKYHFTFKYPTQSWEQLQHRRNAIDKAIANIDKLKDSASEEYALPSYDVLPLLYSIMENTVAIHSSLPREHLHIEFNEITRVYPNGSDLLNRDIYNVDGKSISIGALEEAVVPEQIWESYTEWGQQVQSELERALGDNPAATMMLTTRQQDMFFDMFAREFKRDEVSYVAYDAGLFSNEKHYALKIDMPLLVGKGIKDYLYYQPHWPSGFLKEVNLPYDVVKELKELEHVASNPDKFFESTP